MIEPLQVHHGLSGTLPFYCLAFRFDGILYMSDVGYIPESIFSKMKDLNCLILDCFEGQICNNCHFSFKDCKDTIERVRPKLAVLIGISHKSEHFALQKRIDNAKFLSKTIVGFDMLSICFTH